MFRKLLGKHNEKNACLQSAMRRRIKKAYKDGEIGTVYDIGAHRGKWSKTWSRVMPRASFFMFEANPAMREALTQAGFWFLIAALSNSEKKRQFFARGGTGDSFYRETSGKYDGIEPINVMTACLDTVIASHQISPPDFIKVDAQGSEIDILEGGIAAYANAKFLLSELPITRYNAGAPSIDTYISRYAEIGFHPSILCEVHKRNGCLVQIDMLFERYQDQQK